MSLLVANPNFYNDVMMINDACSFSWIFITIMILPKVNSLFSLLHVCTRRYTVIQFTMSSNPGNKRQNGWSPPPIIGVCSEFSITINNLLYYPNSYISCRKGYVGELCNKTIAASATLILFYIIVGDSFQLPLFCVYIIASMVSRIS